MRFKPPIIAFPSGCTATAVNNYDDFNRRTKTTYPDATYDAVVYDDFGRKVQQSDQAGVTTGFAYDDLARLNAVTNVFAMTPTDTEGTANQTVNPALPTRQRSAAGR